MTEDIGQSERQQPARIRRLPTQVVNRIAAGEVVVRPSAALKELLENCLDAGATSITVTARGGGLKLLQIADNGSGIPLEDLPLLCERFATSKLKLYDDLEEISTFGFRGEALASISHVARLSVLTKTADSNVAYRASFVDGKMRAEAQATAGVKGTTMIVEDMFYNFPTRKQSVKSEADEYRSIVQVVSRYAIRYSDVAFICRKQQTGGSSRVIAGADVRTEVESSVLDNIRAGFGGAVANELTSFDVALEEIEVKMSAYVSTANFSMKKGVFILFINGRLVECVPLRRAIWAVYSNFLPKNGNPFVFLDLVMRQCDIDVNVHPSKKEVRFLHETSIIEGFVGMLSEKLKRTETSRTFLTQSILVKGSSSGGMEMEKASVKDVPASAQKRIRPEESSEDSEEESSSSESEEVMDEAVKSAGGNKRDVNEEKSIFGKRTRPESVWSQGGKKAISKDKERKRVVYAKDKVRSGSHAPVGLLDAYVTKDKEGCAKIGIASRKKGGAGSKPLLTSVEELLRKVEEKADVGLMQVFREHLFVGLATSEYALVQYSSKLLLVEIEGILSQLIYQKVLQSFGEHETFSLEPAAPIELVIGKYLTSGEAGGAGEGAGAATKVLVEKAEMLGEYFGIEIKDDGKLWKLPLILPGMIGDMRALGRLLFKIAVETEWGDESACLGGICGMIGDWFAREWMVAEVGENDEVERREWMLEHVLFGAMRKDFFPARTGGDERIVRQVTCTSKLYKIFERC